MFAATNQMCLWKVSSFPDTRCTSTLRKQSESSSFHRIQSSTRLNAQLPGSGPTAMLNVKQPPILVVAALSYELQKLKSLAHTGIVLLETGEGIKNAKRQLDDWLEGNDARAVLNIGFAGGL